MATSRVPMLGRTRYFEPVAHCDGAVRELLRVSAADQVMCD